MKAPNYEFIKRQKEMKKAKKNEEKRLKKQNKAANAAAGIDDTIETVIIR